MIDRRLLLVAFLVMLPILVCVGFGAHAIWVTGYWKTLWWVLPGCWLFAWLIAKLWKRRDATIEFADEDWPRHWDRRDVEASKIIEKRQRDLGSMNPGQLSDPHHYLSEAQSLASELAAFYHGDQKSESSVQSIDSLTVVEVAAAARLAIDDLESWILKSVPGSRLLTIRQWRSVTNAPKWYSQVSNIYWGVSTLVNPTNLLRYFTSKATIGPVVGQLQTELIATVYLNYLRRVGFYLIEMNSGRLRGGAGAYLATFGDETAASSTSTTDAMEQPLTIALIGQTSAGKSSLINAIVGNTVATVDVLPETQLVARYEHAIDSLAAERCRLTFLDTPGYGEAGISPLQQQEVQTAAINADIIILVIDGHSPARQADQETIQSVNEYFDAMPKLRRPPIVGVLTHIDLIPPASVWSPPYDLQSPVEAKEENIRSAMDYASEVFGDSLAGITSVCLREGPEQSWGVVENLLPELIRHLTDGRSAALVRMFETQVDSKRLQNVLSQIKQLSSDAFRGWINERFAK